MQKKLNSRDLRYLSLILALSIFTKLAASLIIQFSDPSRFHNDFESYEKPAFSLLQCHRFSISCEPSEPPEVIRTPGYPVFIAALYLLFGKHPYAIILWQILISAGTILLVFLAAKAWWGSPGAYVAALLLALDHSSFLYSMQLVTETIFTFFLFGSVYTGLSLLEMPSWKNRRAFLCGLLLAIATMIRPISYYSIIAVATIVALYYILSGRNYKELTVTAILILTPWFIMIGGWKVRNKIVSGTFEFSQITSINLLGYRAASVLARRDHITLNQARAKLEKEVSGELVSRRKKLRHPGNQPELHTTILRYQIAKEISISLIVKNPFLYLRDLPQWLYGLLIVPGEYETLRLLLGRESVTLLVNGPIGDLVRLSPREFIQKWLRSYPARFLLFLATLAHLFFLYTCLVYTLIILVISGRTFPFQQGVVLVYLFYFVIVSSGVEAVHANPRFRVPIMPLLAIYGGALYGREHQKHRKFPGANKAS